MATLAEELTALKTEEDKITGNKVANFSYDDYAYEHNDANGVDTYNVDNHQNIPNGTANILKVNATILTKGWRAQASAITRMLMNHFLGRCSYNLNKVNDHFSALLTKLLAYLEQPNGIATLNSEGKVTALNNVVNTGDSATPVSGGTTKFTTGGAYTELAKKAPNNHASSSTTYGVASASNYGHVKAKYPYSSGYHNDPSENGTAVDLNYGVSCFELQVRSAVRHFDLRNVTGEYVRLVILKFGDNGNTFEKMEITSLSPNDTKRLSSSTSISLDYVVMVFPDTSLADDLPYFASIG